MDFSRFIVNFDRSLRRTWVVCVCVVWVGISEIGYPFFQTCCYIYPHFCGTFWWRNFIKTFFFKGYPISDILSGVYLIMIELLTNAQQLLHSPVEKRKIKEKHAHLKMWQTEIQISIRHHVFPHFCDVKYPQNYSATVLRN